ncbi:MAG: MBL fold metallo-hydrolase [Flavobacteriaceae bacterium]
MNITFLGTGTSQGIPIIGSEHPVCLSNDSRDKRLRVSILMQWNDFNFVVDCGPDFRQQMLNVNCKKLDGILFTHEHADHTAGLDDIRPFYFKQGNINLYAHKRVLKSLKKRFDYIFETKDKYPGAPSVNQHIISENTVFKIGSKKVIPISALHNKLQVFGFRLDTFAYLTDIKTITSDEIDKLKNLDVLVVNALRIEPHISHFNLQEALNFIEIVSPKQAYLTHISHLLGFHSEVEKSLPINVKLAYDNLKISL